MSVDKQELRRLAEAMPDLDWDSNFESNEQTGFCCVYAKPFAIDGEMYDGQTFVEICHPEQAKFIAEAKENILSLLDELERAESDAERLRMQLTACGVVALSNTPESAAKARDMRPDYMSASCQDVMRAVDAEMALRAELEQYRKDAERIEWLADRLEDTMIDGADPCEHHASGENEPWVDLWRRAIDAAMAKEQSQ